MNKFTRLFRKIIKINVRERKQKRHSTSGNSRNLRSFSWVLNFLFTHKGKNGFIPVAASANSRYFSIFPYFLVSPGECLGAGRVADHLQVSYQRLLSTFPIHVFYPGLLSTSPIHFFCPLLWSLPEWDSAAEAHVLPCASVLHRFDGHRSASAPQRRQQLMRVNEVGMRAPLQ